jgi:transcriptional regulator with XRE-family HTH domain
MPQPRKHPLPPMDPHHDDISSRLVKYRKLMGLTQKELAEKIGITRDVLASYESGRIRLFDEMVTRIALALNVSADILLGIDTKTPVDVAALKIMRRIKKIEKLPPAQQKAILQTLDMALKSADQIPSE